MKRRALGAAVSLLGMAVLSGCNRDPDQRASPAQPPGESRPAEESDAPKTSAIVAREGDHLYVVVDVSPLDAKGRKVDRTDVEIDPPAATSKPAAPATGQDRLTYELRVPAATRSLKLSGTSVGGATWSKAISTILEVK